MSNELTQEDIYEGLILTGSPRELSRYITLIHAAGFDFEPHFDPQYIGDAIVVVGKGRTEADVLKDSAPQNEDSPVEQKIEAVVEAVAEINEEVEAPAPDVEAITVEAAGEFEEVLEEAKEEVAEKAKPVRRTRKPKATPAPESTQEG